MEYIPVARLGAYPLYDGTWHWPTTYSKYIYRVLCNILFWVGTYAVVVILLVSEKDVANKFIPSVPLVNEWYCFIIGCPIVS